MKMTTSSLKRKLLANKASVGSWITIPHTAIAEIMLQSPFEWLVIDMEHSATSLSDVQALVGIIEAAGRSPLVRVSENNYTMIKRVMDIGAHGVIVPMVNSKEDAIKAVNAVRYPPKGSRGVGLYRAQEYGEGFHEYVNWLQKESVVIAQIEHINAVENIDEILKVDGIDGIIIGPYDLSGSMGIPGKFDDPKVKGALIKVEAACKKYKKPLGYHIIQPDGNELKKKIESGYTFLAFSIDFFFLGKKCKEELAGVRW